MTMSRKHRRGERGQVLILCAVCLVVLLLFVGLAIDFGFAYVTRSNLGKAVDAAALTAARYYGSQGQDQAILLGASSFAMNYGSPVRDSGNVQPVPKIVFSNDSNNNTLATVTATANINTFFIGMLPQFRTLNVSSVAQSRAAIVEMSLVLDRSGSMNGDGGATYLPGAIQDFITYFDDVKDSVGVVSFSTSVTEELKMATGNFKTPITTLTNTMSSKKSGYFGGGTYSDGGLKLGMTEEASLTPPGNVQKVVLFFTDGGANAIQSSGVTDLLCNGAGDDPSMKSTKDAVWTFGGADPPATNTEFLTPDGLTQKCNQTAGHLCCSGKFTSLAGQPVAITQPNVQAEAINRAIADSNAMRALGYTVYSIGLGSAPAPVDNLFLCQIANDPGSYCAGLGFVTNTSTPAGVAAFAPTGLDLDTAFQTIASIIRLRLTQ